MTKIRIVGVPEHFNLPWHLCLEQNLFAQNHIEVIWQDVPEGTGKMCQMLRQNEADLAIVLTEGIMKDIQLGNPSKIIQKYIETPLIWGVHTAANNPIKTIKDIKDKRFAISRMGSGSHLMSFVYADHNKWLKSDLSFEIVNTIDGAVDALTAQKAQLFMWEKFMTKPLVDTGILKRIDECPTPWPCFSIAMHSEFLLKNEGAVSKLLSIINEMTLNFKQLENVEKTISKRYRLNQKDVDLWLKQTEWSQINFSKDEFAKIQKDLLRFQVIDRLSAYEDIIVNS
jgi:ABC-type nitrate/sulfonate/bicarbonate transport system substrate-binding protein